MFADIAVGFVLTICLSVGLIIGFLASPLRKRKRIGSLFTACLIIGFVPACIGVTEWKAGMRYGTFQVASVHGLSDKRVIMYLPTDAVDIQLDSHAGGFTATYTIGYEQLRSHVLAHFERSGYRGQTSHGENAYQQVLSSPQQLTEEIPQEFVFSGPRAPNGAGYTIVYNPHTQRAEQQSSYW